MQLHAAAVTAAGLPNKAAIAQELTRAQCLNEV